MSQHHQCGAFESGRAAKTLAAGGVRPHPVPSEGQHSGHGDCRGLPAALSRLPAAPSRPADDIDMDCPSRTVNAHTSTCATTDLELRASGSGCQQPLPESVPVVVQWWQYKVAIRSPAAAAGRVVRAPCQWASAPGTGPRHAVPARRHGRIGTLQRHEHCYRHGHFTCGQAP